MTCSPLGNNNETSYLFLLDLASSKFGGLRQFNVFVCFSSIFCITFLSTNPEFTFPTSPLTPHPGPKLRWLDTNQWPTTHIITDTTWTHNDS